MLTARTELKQNLPTPQDLGFATCVLVEANNLICLLINTPFTLPIPKLQSCCSYAVSAEQQLRNLGMGRVKGGRAAGAGEQRKAKNPARPTESHPLAHDACSTTQRVSLHAQQLTACRRQNTTSTLGKHFPQSISGLVVEYIVAIDVTRVRFPADTLCD